MSIAKQAPEYIRAISPYIPGKPMTQLAREMGIPVDKIVKLASNENPLGMSPRARVAVEQAIAGIERYPDQFDLIKALADRTRLAQEQIVLGNGSNDVLDLAARVFLAPGRSAVMAQHAFAVYPLATVSTGAECIVVPAKHYGHDLDAMLAAIRSDTRLVWIANPNNPTGNFLPYSEIKAFLAKVPAAVAVVLDEAYNNLALAAAIAALDDHVFLAESYQLNRRGMEQLVTGIKRLGLEHIPSHGNFVTFKVSDGGAVNQKLLRQGVIVRPIGGYGLPNHLRVTIGLERENDCFLQALEQALNA